MLIETLPTGILGYIENPITTLKPYYNKISDLITLILSVVHTYLPDKTEPNIVLYHDMKRRNNYK